MDIQVNSNIMYTSMLYRIEMNDILIVQSGIAAVSDCIINCFWCTVIYDSQFNGIIVL